MSERSANLFRPMQNEELKDEQLLAAAKKGDVLALKRALEEGANPNYINRKDEGSPFVLHETVKIDNVELGVACTKALLYHGANSNTRTITTKNTPLHEGD